MNIQRRVLFPVARAVNKNYFTPVFITTIETIRNFVTSIVDGNACAVVTCKLRFRVTLKKKNGEIFKIWLYELYYKSCLYSMYNRCLNKQHKKFSIYIFLLAQNKHYCVLVIGQGTCPTKLMIRDQLRVTISMKHTICLQKLPPSISKTKKCK